MRMIFRSRTLSGIQADPMNLWSVIASTSAWAKVPCDIKVSGFYNKFLN